MLLEQEPPRRTPGRCPSLPERGPTSAHRSEPASAAPGAEVRHIRHRPLDHRREDGLGDAIRADLDWCRGCFSSRAPGLALTSDGRATLLSALLLPRRQLA